MQCGYLIKDNDHNTIYMYPRAETINYKMHPIDNSEKHTRGGGNWRDRKAQFILNWEMIISIKKS